MARAPLKPRKYPLIPHTYALSTDDEQTLERLRHDASAALGWTVGNSAVVRALLRYAAQQSPGWATAALHPLIGRKLDTGTFWGSKKK
jgi:hypothetical protein